LDPANPADVAFWEAHNPDILAMAASAKVNPTSLQDMCCVRLRKDRSLPNAVELSPRTGEALNFNPCAMIHQFGGTDHQESSKFVCPCFSCISSVGTTLPCISIVGTTLPLHFQCWHYPSPACPVLAPPFPAPPTCGKGRR
jgi:hypothetical protein